MKPKFNERKNPKQDLNDVGGSRPRGRLNFSSANQKCDAKDSQEQDIMIEEQKHDSRQSKYKVKKIINTEENKEKEDQKRNRLKSLNEMQYSVQRPGLNNVNRVKIKEEKKIKKDASGKMYVPMKVLFKSNYDRFGKIADNKSKELS